MKSLTALLLIVLFFSCTNEEQVVAERSMKYDGKIVKGAIETSNGDTIFNGVIRFYDPKTNTLLKEVTYRDNILDGRKTTYSNGKKVLETYYKEGIQHGASTYFNSNGQIEQTDNYYHGIWSGPEVIYRNNEPGKFHFITFESDWVFTINYDSLKGKSLEKEDLNFFPLSYRLVTMYYDTTAAEETEIQLYMLNPPKLNFKYTVCYIDNHDKVTEVVEDLDNSEIFRVFSYNEKLIPANQYIALRLTCTDEINNRSFELFQKLPTEKDPW